MSLAQLKKSNSLDKLLGAVQSENSPQEKKSYVDDRIWKPVMDKTGTGFAMRTRHSQHLAATQNVFAHPLRATGVSQPLVQNGFHQRITA